MEWLFEQNLWAAGIMVLVGAPTVGALSGAVRMLFRKREEDRDEFTRQLAAKDELIASLQAARIADRDKQLADQLALYERIARAMELARDHYPDPARYVERDTRPRSGPRD